MLPLWNFFLEKKQFTYLLVAAVSVAGLYSLLQMPKESTPSIDIPYGIVSTVFPGASAVDTETLVTTKLENEISNIANIDKMTSSSGDGVSVITVQFSSSADTNQSIQSLRDAVSKVAPTLPADAKTPSVSKINFSDQPILVASISGDLPPTELSRLGHTISDDIKNVVGVSRVDVAGVPDAQVTVVVAKEDLELYGLRLVDVISAISSSNAAIPAGSITMDGVNYDVNFKGGITDPNQISTIAVGSKNGVPIYLRDIAFISNGLAPATTYSRVSVAGAPSNQAITISVYKQSGGNVAGIATNVKNEILRMQKTQFPNEVVLIPEATDQGVQVGKQLGDLTKTGFETVALVMIVLLLTIGWRESLVAALSIPLSFLIAFIGLYLTGNSLNISLFALILAVGILVDSGIVVTEAIHTRVTIYKNPLKAARAALHDYAWPLIAGTMATVAVFAPLFFISGIIGKFIGGIPYTIIFVLLASVFVALGIVPLIAILLTKKSSNRLEILQEEYTEKVTHWYKAKLRLVLEHRRWQNYFILFLVAMFVVSLMLPVVGLVQTIFFAQGDVDYVYINIQKPRGTTLQVTDLAAREVEEILYADPDVASFSTTVGQSSALSGSGFR
jgi:multidrug efflux pump